MTETKIIKLSANENCYGCSEKVNQAIEKKYKQAYIYPDMFPVKLQEKIAEKHKVNAANVVIGPGSVSLINNLIQAYSIKGDEILTFERSFIAYGQLSQVHGRVCKFAPLKNLCCAPQNLLPLINEKTRLIFIANPNNPTGTIITHTELEFLLNNVPEKVIVVHDEAYAEYVMTEDFPDSISLQKKFKNLIVLRSFSKIYGLAGLRAGYAVADIQKASDLSKLHLPYSLNYLMADAALAALEDEEFVKRSAQLNAIEALRLYDEIKKLGFDTVKSHSNFIYVQFPSDTEKKKVYDKLFQSGIHICDLSIFGQNKALRIGVGTKETNTQIIEIISSL